MSKNVISLEDIKVKFCVWGEFNLVMHLLGQI
jgi:hypothetical protein